MTSRFLTAALAASITASITTGPLSAQPAQQQEQQQSQAAAQQKLVLGQTQLQQAATHLQRAKDTGQLDAQQIGEARRMVDSGLDQLDAALKDLQGVKTGDEAQQAIRNTRQEMQSAKQAMTAIEADAPEPAIQALKDLQQAAAEVQETAQLTSAPQ